MLHHAGVTARWRSSACESLLRMRVSLSLCLGNTPSDVWFVTWEHHRGLFCLLSCSPHFLLQFFKHCGSCHLQKFSDNHIFVEWFCGNHLLLRVNVTKTKEIAVSFSGTGSRTQPRNILGQEAEVTGQYKYLDVYLNYRLERRTETDAVYKEVMNRLYSVQSVQSVHASIRPANTRL